MRVVARLDFKGSNLIKAVQLEGLRALGSAGIYSKRYYREGADELLVMDIVASLYERNFQASVIEEIADDIFIPITVGGGIRTVDDARNLLRVGADKLAVNTAVVRNPDLLSSLVDHFGSQCIVASIEAKKISHKSYEIFTESGRERTGISVEEWLDTVQLRGVGEILITSIDREGTRQGFDLELIDLVSSKCDKSLVVSGGFGRFEQMDSMRLNDLNAIAIADAFHFGRVTVPEFKSYLGSKGCQVRPSDDDI